LSLIFSTHHTKFFYPLGFSVFFKIYRTKAFYVPYGNPGVKLVKVT
jgi:hypothetical protein